MTVKQIKILILFGLLGALIWFGPQLAGRQSEAGLFAKGQIELHNGNEKQQLTVDIAAKEPAWHKGMMHRQEWGGIEGMLFIFDSEQPRRFWMKNTHLPLDIIFFDARGQVASIAEHATPFSEEMIPSLLPAKYVLEIPAGDVEKRMLNDDTTLDVDGLEGK